LDWEKYKQLILCGKTNEAEIMKNADIPQKLYKFISLSEDEEENEKRFQTLENRQIYMSPAHTFNDPYDGKYLFFNKENTYVITRSYRMIVDMWRVACLSKQDYLFLPMWAYYANSHKGFCIEYCFTDAQKPDIMPVMYEPLRVDGTAFFEDMIKGVLDPGYTMNDKFSKSQEFIHLSLATKHYSWAHEQEYRIMAPREKYGNFYSATPRKIYIGINCKHQHTQRLINIAAGIGGCEIYQMKYNEHGEEFDLIAEKIDT